MDYMGEGKDLVWKCALFHSWRTLHIIFIFLNSIFCNKTTENFVNNAQCMHCVTHWPASLSTLIY